jgi:hypothetical protein
LRRSTSTWSRVRFAASMSPQCISIRILCLGAAGGGAVTVAADVAVRSCGGEGAVTLALLAEGRARGP